MNDFGASELFDCETGTDIEPGTARPLDTRGALLAAIRSHPAENTPRLLYADGR